MADKCLTFRTIFATELHAKGGLRCQDDAENPCVSTWIEQDE